MSGRELDPDGTDSFHPEHPWEQVGHRLYIPPSERTRWNWPPVKRAKPAGPHEARQWAALSVSFVPGPHPSHDWRDDEHDTLNICARCGVCRCCSPVASTEPCDAVTDQSIGGGE